MKVPSVSLISPYFMVFFRFCHFRHFFNNNLDCTSRVICACLNQIILFSFCFESGRDGDGGSLFHNGLYKLYMLVIFYYRYFLICFLLFFKKL